MYDGDEVWQATKLQNKWKNVLFFLQKQSYIHLLPDLYFPSGLLAAKQQLRPPQNVAQRFGEL